MLPQHMCAASAVRECVKHLSEDDCVSRKPYLIDARPGALAGPGCSAPSGSPSSTAKDFRELPSDADLYQDRLKAITISIFKHACMACNAAPWHQRSGVWRRLVRNGSTFHTTAGCKGQRKRVRVKGNALAASKDRALAQI